MTREQQRYLWGEVYPAFAYGMDRVARAMGIHPPCATAWDIHLTFKERSGIGTTTRLGTAEAADYITEIMATAGNAGILITSPEEWHRGVAEQLREAHYRWIEA